MIPKIQFKNDTTTTNNNNNIPLHLDIVPKDGANKPDIAICNKKKRQWLLFEGTVCNIGQIQERDKLKTEKYADLRAS